MRKVIAMLLAVSMALCLTACGAEEESNADLVITRAPEEAGSQSQGGKKTEESVSVGGVFAFTAGEVELIPGEPFDASVLGEASYVFQVPSCAVEGTDNVYNYESFEVTAFDDGTGEVIYSILVVDPNLTTAEGLALGDDLAQVEALYGADYVQDGNALVYTRGNTQLYLILQDEVVISIEYRMAV